MKGMTVKQIMMLKPCDRYTEETIENLRKKICGKRKIITKQDVYKAPVSVEDKLWLLLREEYFTELQLHNIAIWCWKKIARPIWEKYYPDDKRPHEIVRIKKLWLKNKATDKELDAAKTAAMTATRTTARYAAMAAARVAIWAAIRGETGSATRDMTWAATRDATWAVARAVTRAMTWAETWDMTKAKILNYIIRLK